MVPEQSSENKKEPLKGALLFNLSVILQTLSYVVGKFIYLQPAKINPMQLLFVRCVVGLAGLLVWFNTKFMNIIWHDIPAGSFKSLVIRGVTCTTVNLIQYSVIKYLNLVFVGIASNAVPPITALLSFLFIGELLKARHIC